MPLRYYRYCLGRHDHFAMLIARTVLAAPLLSVIFVSIMRGWMLLLPARTFQKYQSTFALMSYGGWLSEFAWGAVEFATGTLLLVVSIAYLRAGCRHVVRRTLYALAALLCWQTLLSAGTATMIFCGDNSTPIWVWFVLRFGLAMLAFFQVVCVLQGECGGISEERLKLVTSGTEGEQRKRLRAMPDEELRRAYFQQKREQRRRTATG